MARSASLLTNLSLDLGAYVDRFPFTWMVRQSRTQHLTPSYLGFTEAYGPISLPDGPPEPHQIESRLVTLDLSTQTVLVIKRAVCVNHKKTEYIKA
jgi:hypothetical protein